MVKIEIDLSKENIEKRTDIEKEEFITWLDRNKWSFTGLESNINKRKGNINELLMGLATMEIELDTAADYSRKKEVDIVGYILAQTRQTKDFIYSQLMQIYNNVDSEGRILSLDLDGDLTLWRDYIMQKYDGGIKRCEFLISNNGFS